MGYIYLTTNLVNGKKYIGQSSFTSKESTSYLGSGKYLIKAVKKYGKHSFHKDIIEEGNFSVKHLDELEIKYIKDHDAVKSPNYYNISPGGRGGRGYTSGIIYEYDYFGVLVNTYYSIHEASGGNKSKARRITECCKTNHPFKKCGYFYTKQTSNIIPRLNFLIRVESTIDNTVHHFQFAVDCAKFIGVKNATVHEVLRNGGGRVKKYLVYFGEALGKNFTRKAHNTNEPLYEYTVNGNLLNVYENTNVASEVLGVNITTLRQATNTNRMICSTLSYFTKDKSQIKPRRIARKLEPVYEYNSENELLNIFIGRNDVLKYYNINMSTLAMGILNNSINSTTGTIFSTQLNINK